MRGVRGGRTTTRAGALRLAVALAAVAALVVAPGAGSTSVLFQTHADYTTGSAPYNPVIADLNGDGHPDLVVPLNFSSEGVSVLLNHGDGTFPTHTDYATPAGTDSNGASSYAAVGDLNGDGHPDIAFTYGNGADGIVGVLINNGDGTFATAVGYGAGVQPEGVGIGDFNGDGFPDIAVAASGSNAVYVYLGNGDGTFQSGTPISVDSGPWGLAVADVNGDGNDDIVSMDHGSSKVATLLGNGDGTFQSHVDSTSTGGATVMQLADMNGDGTPDVVTIQVGSVQVQLGNGDGTFGTTKGYPAPNNVYDLGVGDINGDGKIDVVATNLVNNGTISVLLGNGDGTLGSHTEYSVGSYPIGAAVGDLDGDGHADIAVANSNSNSVSVLIQQLSSDNNLSSLNVSAGQLSPTFDPATTDYTDVIPSNQSSFTVVPTVEDSTATVQARVNGGAYSSVASGQLSNPLPLNYGDNEVDVLVTAQDGSTQTYTIDVTRLHPFQCAPTPTYPCWTQFTVDGNDPPAGLQLQTYSLNGSVIVGLQYNGGYELSGALDANSDVHAEILLGTYDPVVFATTGKVASYQETTSPGTNYIDLDVSPTASSWNANSCQIGNCGTDQSPLTATHDYADMLLGFVNDLSGSANANNMRGTWIATNAQSFSLPTYNASLGSFAFQVASPHFKSNGTTVNTGFFQAFMPDQLVEAMGMPDPSQVSGGNLQVSSSNGGSVGVDVSHDDTTGGVLVQSTAPFDYSSPQFTITQAVDHLLVSSDASAPAGSNLGVEVQAVGAQGGVVPGYTGTVSFSGGGANVTLPADYTFTAGDAGTHFFNAVLRQAGFSQITATDTANGSITGTSDLIEIDPGPADHLTFSSSTAPSALGLSRPLDVEVDDAYGNLESSDESTVISFADVFGDGSVSGLQDATVGDGRAEVIVTGTRSGTVVIEATAGDLSGSTQFDVLAKDGSGTMSVSPTRVKHGTATLVAFTYTAPAGGIANGVLTLSVPPGWTAPSSLPTRPGYPVASAGTVGVRNRFISITGLTLAAGKKLTILYDRKGTVTAPPTAVGAQTWSVTERSSGSGVEKPIAASPKITVN